MNLIKLLKNIDYTTKDELNNINISHITHNSKEVQNGALFIALSGCNTDGNNYINEAIQNGAYAIVSELESNECSIPYIEVNNSRKIMSEISNNFYRKCNEDIKIIGVTGTNGKTSICQIINHILNEIILFCNNKYTRLSNSLFKPASSTNLFNLLLLILRRKINKNNPPPIFVLLVIF